MQTAQFNLHAEIEQAHWWFQARRQIMRAVIEQVLPPGPDATVIDVGCGTGANLAALQRDYGCIGIDTSADAIRLARQRFPQVEFIHGSAPRDLGDRASEAQLYLLMDVLEHVPDDFALLSELLSSAAAGCYFLLTVPADMALWSPHDESFGHYRRYTLPRLRRVWEGLPVETIAASYFNTRLYPLIRAHRAVNRRRGAAAGAAGTDFAIPSRPVNWALRRLFAGESKRLVDLVRGRRTDGYARGVSLMALLRRQSGAVPLREKPDDVEPDAFDPCGEPELAASAVSAAGR